LHLLVTGGFGHIGKATLREAAGRGHQVTALARRSPHNERAARKLARELPSEFFRIHWGDMRDPDSSRAAVTGQDAVIHLAAMLPPHCDEHAAACEAVNVGGTASLLEATKAEAARCGNGGPAIVYASSVSVMGATQHKDPPVRIDDHPRPSDTYSRTKVDAENLVREAALPWSILRLSAVMPTSGMYRLSMARLMFDMALAARCEIVLDLDAAYALVQTAVNLCDGGAARGKTWFVAGGADNGCQMTIEDMLRNNLQPFGLRLPRADLFPTDLDSYYLDWYETAEGQSILGYQRHGVDDWQRLACRRFRWLRRILWLVRWPANRYLGCVGILERRRRHRAGG